MSKKTVFKKPSVLFITSSTGCPRIWRMARTLSKEGYSIRILEWDRECNLNVNEIRNKVTINRFHLSAPYGFKMIFFLPIWWIFLSIFLLIQKEDIIQPQNLDNLIPVKIFTKIKKYRIVYDIADFYSDAFIPSSLSKIRPFVSLMERFLIQTNYANIIVDINRLSQVNTSKKSIVINNSPYDIFSPNNALIDNRSRFTLFYAGILSEDRGLRTVIAAIKDLDSVKLVIAGFGAEEKNLAKLIRNINNVEFIGRIPYDKVLDFTISSDCIIALYDPSFPINKHASPNKMFEAMMCGKPIITNRGTSMAKIVETEKCGKTVDYDNIIQLREAIITLRDSPDTARTLGENGRLVYLKSYSWSIMEQRIVDLYNSLLFEHQSRLI